jgi:DNA-binding MarR family transcriptional regulator
VDTPEVRLMDALSDLTLPFMWRLRQDAMRAFEGLGVRPMKALLLELIAGGLQSPKAISDVLDTVPPTISAMLGDLERQGLITRQTDPDDRRRVLLTLTGAGEALRRDMQAAWRRMGRSRYEGLSEAELTALLSIMQKLAGNPEGESGGDAGQG